jgi:hypothetical protein
MLQGREHHAGAEAGSPSSRPKRAETAPAADVFRMLRRELEALGTPEAVAELERRREKRARKRAERVAA